MNEYEARWSKPIGISVLRKRRTESALAGFHHFQGVRRRSRQGGGGGGLSAYVKLCGRTRAPRLHICSYCNSRTTEFMCIAILRTTALCWCPHGSLRKKSADGRLHWLPQCVVRGFRASTSTVPATFSTFDCQRFAVVYGGHSSTDGGSYAQAKTLHNMIHRTRDVAILLQPLSTCTHCTE